MNLANHDYRSLAAYQNEQTMANTAIELQPDPLQDHSFEVPEDIRKTEEDLVTLTGTCLPFIQDPSSTTRQYRLALGQILLATLENRALKSQGIIQGIDVADSELNNWMKNFTRRYRHAEQIPFKLTTSKSPENKKIGGYTLDLNSDQVDTHTSTPSEEAKKNITEIREEVRKTCSSITELIEKDRTLDPTKNTYFIDHSINIESKFEAIKEAVERITTFKEGDIAGFTEENCTIIKTILKYTLEGKVVLPEEIAKALGIPIEKAKRKVQKLAESLNRSHKVDLKIRFESKPTDARFSGYFLDIEPPKKSDIKTMSPGIEEIPTEEKANLLSNLKLAKQKRFVERNNTLIPQILDLLIQACIRGESITPEYCLHRFKDRKTARNYQDTFLRLQKTAEEEKLGFRLLQKDRKWQAIPSPDKEESPEFVDKLNHNLASSIPHDTEYEKAKLRPTTFRRRVMDSLRHFQVKKLDQLEEVFRFIVEESIKGRYVTKETISQNIKSLGENYYYFIHQWFIRIIEINADATAGNHKSILGYTVIQDGPAKYRFVPIASYTKSEENYTGRAKIWPTPIEKTPEIDQKTLQEILEKLNDRPVEKLILEIYVHYSKRKGKPMAISSKIVEAECKKRGQPLRDPHIQIYDTQNYLEERFPCIRFVKHTTYSYYVECKERTRKPKKPNQPKQPRSLKKTPPQTRRISPEIGTKHEFIQEYLSKIFDVEKNDRHELFHRVLTTLLEHRKKGVAISKDRLIAEAQIQERTLHSITISLIELFRKNDHFGLQVAIIDKKFYTIEITDVTALILTFSNILRSKLEAGIEKLRVENEALEDFRAGAYKKTYRYQPDLKPGESDQYSALQDSDLILLMPGTKEYDEWEDRYGLKEGETLVKFKSANGKSPIIRAPKKDIVQKNEEPIFDQEKNSLYRKSSTLEPEDEWDNLAKQLGIS